MKLFLLFVAVIGFVSADTDEDLTVIKQFIECVHRALSEGVPSIPIPIHDPLVIDDYLRSTNIGIVALKIALTSNVLTGLLNYTIPVLNATDYHNPEAVAYDYDVYWPKLLFTGNWEIDTKTPTEEEDLNGTFTIELDDVDWWGIFNVTRAGQEAQGYNNSVNAFTLQSSTKSVSAIVTGGDSAAGAVEDTLQFTIQTLFNNFPAAVGESLRERFNKFWIEQNNIGLLLDWCANN